MHIHKLQGKFCLQGKSFRGVRCFVSKQFEGLHDLCKTEIPIQCGVPNPRPGVDVTFHANSPAIHSRQKVLHLNKADCDFHMQHLTIYHLIVIS